MGKPIESRNHAKNVRSSQSGMTADQIRQSKNGRAAQRAVSRKDERIAQAEARNARWRSLTPQQQIETLDKRFGVGCGATKQRARIAAKG